MAGRLGGEGGRWGRTEVLRAEEPDISRSAMIVGERCLNRSFLRI